MNKKRMAYEAPTVASLELRFEGSILSTSGSTEEGSIIPGEWDLDFFSNL